jgi:hypothetical protein
LEAFLSGGQHWGVVFSVIQFLVLGGRQITECFVESLVVVEADPLVDLVLGVLEAGGASPVDALALEGRGPGFGHCIVIGVALRADRGIDPELVEPVGVGDARVLGAAIRVRDQSRAWPS